MSQSDERAPVRLLPPIIPVTVSFHNSQPQADIDICAPRPLFLYGTLLCAPLLAWLLTGSSHNTALVGALTTPARLRGFARAPLHALDYPALIPTANGADSVRGLLLRPQIASQRRKIDDFEGETYCVEPVVVQLLGAGGNAAENGEVGEVEADAYVWAGNAEMVMHGQEWDLERFRRERLDDWLEIFGEMEMVV